MIQYEQKAGKNYGRGRPREFDRELALHKALKLFWEQGYIQTTMIQLCQAMEIKSPSLYCAFGSKANLFLEALSFYRHTYWDQAFADFMETEDLYQATEKLFRDTARILLMPDAPCGCLTVFSAMTLPARETKILLAITNMRQQTRKMFRDRLMRAIHAGQIAPDVNVPAIAGSLLNFFEGLTLQAREEGICLAELTEIALQGLKLLPESMCETIPTGNTGSFHT